MDVALGRAAPVAAADAQLEGHQALGAEPDRGLAVGLLRQPRPVRNMRVAQFVGMRRDERGQRFAAEFGRLEKQDEVDRELHLRPAVAFYHPEDCGDRPLGVLGAARDDALAIAIRNRCGRPRTGQRSSRARRRASCRTCCE